MKISLVTISLNQREFLERAVRSVFEQKYPDLEHIVVDAGSTDGSRELIESHHSRFAQVIMEPDQGPADGLTKGFRHATGEVFGFLNADDLLLPGSLGAVGSYFKEHASCDVLMGDGFIIDTNDRVLRHIRAHSCSVGNQLYGGARWLQQSTFFRRGIFEAVGGFNCANRTCWDGELILDFAVANARFEYLRQNLGCFRRHDESFTVLNKMAPTRQHAVAYKVDQSRMFEKIYGRRRTQMDSVRSFASRGMSVLGNPHDALEASAERLRQRFECARTRVLAQSLNRSTP